MPKMLKLSLVAMFVLSIGTLSFASSLMPMPEARNVGMIETTAAAPVALAMADTEARLWVQTFE